MHGLHHPLRTQALPAGTSGKVDVTNTNGTVNSSFTPLTLWQVMCPLQVTWPMCHWNQLALGARWLCLSLAR